MKAIFFCLSILFIHLFWFDRSKLIFLFLLLPFFPYDSVPVWMAKLKCVSAFCVRPRTIAGKWFSINWLNLHFLLLFYFTVNIMLSRINVANSYAWTETCKLDWDFLTKQFSLEGKWKHIPHSQRLVYSILLVVCFKSSF